MRIYFPDTCFDGINKLKMVHENASVDPLIYDEIASKHLSVAYVETDLQSN